MVEHGSRRFRPGRGLLRNFFHAIRATSASDHAAVGNDGLALFQCDAVAGPENLIADAIGEIDAACQREANHAGMCIVETGIVRAHNRIVIGSPFEFARSSHSTWNDRVRIDKAALQLAQGFFLHALEIIAAGFRGLPFLLRGGCACVEQRRAQIPQSDNCGTERETRED